MGNKFAKAFIGIILVLAFVGTGLAQKANRTDKGFDKLTPSVELNKAEYFPLEPIYAHIALTNNTGGPVRIAFLPPNSGFFLSVRHGGNERVFRNFLFVREHHAGFGRVIRPRESVIEVAASTPKDSYLLGETIPLSIEIRNLSGKDIAMIDTFDPMYGSLKLYVSNDDKSVNYQYLNPAFGLLDMVGFINIRANQKLSRSLQLLARKKNENKADYFFNSVGTYYLEVSYQFKFLREPLFVEVKSEPIKITITEPQGQDLEVWNKIKNDGDIANFIQEGDFLIPSYKPEERAKFQQEVEQILADHPSSIYAGPMRTSLEKYKANEEKRKKFRRQMEQRQKPEPKK